MQVLLTLAATLLALPLFINASPVAPGLAKRALTNCGEKWMGELIMTHITNPPQFPNQIPAHLNSDGTLLASVNKGRSPIPVHFDTCNAPGWIVGGREFGQIRLIADHETCLTVDSPGSPQSTLSFKPCVDDTTNPILASQWVEGFTGPSGAYNLVFKGNPNDPSSTDRSQVSFNYGDLSSALNPVKIGTPTGGLPTRFQLLNKRPVVE